MLCELVVLDIEDEDEPGIVGERSGCAVRDSREFVRGRRWPPPDARLREVGGKRVSRLLIDMVCVVC